MSLALMAARGTHDRPGGWTPAQLGTLDLWLDADDATTITIATGVSQWDDKSGNARHATNVTGSTQPDYVVNSRSGQAALSFNTQKVLGLGDVLDLGTGSVSILAAFNSANSTGVWISKTNNAVDVNGEWQCGLASIDIRMGGASAGAGGTSSSGARIHASVVDRSNGAYHYANGTLAGSLTTSPYPNTDNLGTASGVLIGQRIFNSSSVAFSGTLFEIVVSLSALSDGDREKVEGYLAHKWGMVGNLPSTHPYKEAAP